MTNPDVSIDFDERRAMYHIWAGSPGTDPQPMGSVVHGDTITVEQVARYISGERSMSSPREWVIFETLRRTKMYGGLEDAENRDFDVGYRHRSSFADFRSAQLQ